MWIVCFPKTSIEKISFFNSFSWSLCLSSLLCYVFFSTKLEIRAEQVLPGSEEGRQERVEEVGRGEK
jgi:hypothetical protein